MATNYSKKCNSCGGNKWEYDRQAKIWICRYCGNQVERQEQYDGLHTIKNVVRQVILDSAYVRLTQADRGLSECQMINARYVGTLVAGICCRLIAAVNGGMSGQDPRSLLGQIKRDYQLLTQEDDDLSDDETALYEFLDSSDAWAVLATAFDTLGDARRRDYLLTLVDPGQVFSKETNKSLLRFALKNGREQLAEQILANTDNIDVPDAFQAVLEQCPDGGNKGTLAAKLLAAGAVTPGEESCIEDYLGGGDCVATKAAVALGALLAGLTLHMDIFIREVLSGLEVDPLRQMLGALFARRLFDGEIEQLLDFSAAQPDGSKCLAVLDAMVDSGQFISLNVRQAQNFMCNTASDPQQRKAILERLRKFTGADRMWETVAGYYLCQGKESAENRSAVFSALTETVTSIPAKDFEQYVLRCGLDEESKPERIRQVLELSGMNTGFFRELAGRYLKTGGDTQQLRPAVLHQLLSSGLEIDSAVLVDYVCTPGDTEDNKVDLLQLAVKNGTALRADALSIYLEKCHKEFSSKIFAALYRDGSSVTAKALENYVLYCADAPGAKAANALALAKRTGISLGASGCTVKHLTNMVTCSLAQAYILTTGDEIALATRMVDAMTGSGTRLNTDVKAGGRTVKFSRYLNDNKASLSAVTTQLCQENRLFGFSLFG